MPLPSRLPSLLFVLVLRRPLGSFRCFRLPCCPFRRSPSGPSLPSYPLGLGCDPAGCSFPVPAHSSAPLSFSCRPSWVGIRRGCGSGGDGCVVQGHRHLLAL